VAQTQTPSATHACDPASRVTKSLLGYGVIAGPFYVVVSLAQALTRDGFDLTRHSWSLLSNGDLGWLQITNFVLTGLMVLAFAAGLRRATGRRTAPVLIGIYGASLIAAGALRADPSEGFPVGTPAGQGPVSWHGLGHFAAGGIGFLCLIAACFVVSRALPSGLALFSRITGVGFLAGFIGIASGSGNPVTVLAFVAAVLLAWTWLSSLAVHTYRRVEN
jgi:hypothetical protein